MKRDCFLYREQVAGSSMLVEGFEVVGSSRTITDAEIALLPALMGVINPLFHDEETQKRSAFGRRILYGPALLGISVACTEPFIRDAVIALVGIDDVRFRRPVGAGDTITPWFRVLERRTRPGEDGDLIFVEDSVRNQDADVVLTFRRVIKVRPV
jgi:acyl dehydratase